uniref:Uncharacterized protein n=1 Tax=Amphimedon queenslandica TaxID=400682 RepID=A0A1X7UIU0_AMPQE
MTGTGSKPVQCALEVLINGQDIKWATVIQLFEKHCLDNLRAPGLSILHKIHHEHIHLTSYSKMRVDLAVQ